MHALSHLILETISIISIVFAAVFSIFALRRFLSGEFYNIAKWITYSFVLLAIHKITEETGNLTEGIYQEVFMYVDHLSFLAGVLCAIRAAYLLYGFSKVYGFREKPRK